MKIYTYYQPISRHLKQPELLDLWKLSWSKQGFTPIILTQEDAVKHAFYNEFSDKIRNISNTIRTENITDYGMSCWLRWLAYSTQPDEPFYVSDYDAINVNFLATKPNNKLHLMDNDCPFFASGTPKQFENLCRAFIEVSNERMDVLKSQTSLYHDQEFFMYNMMPHNNTDFQKYRDRYNILMTRDRKEVGGGYDPVKNQCIAGPHIGYTDLSSCRVLHLSHQNISSIKTMYSKTFEGVSETDLRIHMIERLLDSKK